MIATKPKWKVLARHKNWVKDCTITESLMDDAGKQCPSRRRFTSTIGGWGSFRVYEGPAGSDAVQAAKLRTMYIKDRIGRGDEAVFHEKNAADRSEIIHGYWCQMSLTPPPLYGGHKHLFGFDSKRHGHFLVSNDRMTLDREAFREIAAEAKQLELVTPYVIYGRTCCYSGPGIDFIQITAR